MVAVWVLSVLMGDASIVDIVWGLLFVVIAWVAAAVGVGGSRSTLLAVLITLWGVRLAGYLAWRNLGHGEDSRYVAMRRRIGPWFWLVSLFSVFTLQGLLALVVASPVMLAASARNEAFDFGPFEVLGLLVVAVGLFFEVVGDAQLARFKAAPSSAGAVMDRGLWRYTRHPNYFGDFCVWWGLFAVAIGAGGRVWLGIVGPVVMSVLLLRVSGVALLERSIGRRRPAYAAYVERTSAFLPRPPRR